MKKRNAGSDSGTDAARRAARRARRKARQAKFRTAVVNKLGGLVTRMGALRQALDEERAKVALLESQRQEGGGEQS